MAGEITGKVRIRLLEIGVPQAALAVIEASPYALSRRGQRVKGARGSGLKN